jgi:thiosulfate/3-mercaptopyruvate sulfurtransferase
MDSLVSSEWLAQQLGASDLRIVDASWHLPDAGRDAAAEYAAGHIPGAVFLNLGTLVDSASLLDNTVPPAETFASRMQSLGISDGDRIVVYDDSAAKTATRGWFLFRLFGAKHVAILDGGLAKWKAEGRALDAEVPTPKPGQFTALFDDSQLRSKAQVISNLDGNAEQVLDARGAPRFAGSEPEPRPAVTPGHIPGARNVPYSTLFQADGTWKDTDALRQAFTAAGADLNLPVITSCGSGISACSLIFGLHLLGKHDVALYDGSWGEWGSDPATPKETGAAA